MLNVALPTDTQNILYCHLVSAEPPFIRTRSDVCTKQSLTHLSSIVAAQIYELHFPWAMAPIGQSWTRLQNLVSLQQREYAFQINKIEEIKQRLVELWQSRNTTFEWKDAIFVFPCYAR